MALHSNQLEGQGKPHGQLLFPEIFTNRVLGMLRACGALHLLSAGTEPGAHLIFGVGFARCKLDVVGMGLDGALQLLKAGQRTWPHTHKHTRAKTPRNFYFNGLKSAFTAVPSSQPTRGCVCSLKSPILSPQNHPAHPRTGTSQGSS